jgi:hypothetical protein
MMIHLSEDGKSETKFEPRNDSKTSLKLAANAEKAQG